MHVPYPGEVKGWSLRRIVIQTPYREDEAMTGKGSPRLKRVFNRAPRSAPAAEGARMEPTRKAGGVSTSRDVACFELMRAIERREATVAVVGLGYVGLPLLMAVAGEGFPVIGLEEDQGKTESLRQRRSYIGDIPNDGLSTLDGATLTTDPTSLRRADIILITVPTPLTDAVPDLSAVRRASAQTAAALQKGQLVILESTSYPGTTEEVVRPILEGSGMRAGEDFYLAYSPERLDPGSDCNLRNTPKIVAGIGERDTDLAKCLYAKFVSKVVTTPSPRDAEMAKLIENTFRQVNIALVNELATLAPDLGVDIWAALEAAATKPFGYVPFWPGPGVGGHCIAIDPSYLSWRVGQRLGYGLGFVEHANVVNNRMPTYVAARIGHALNSLGKAVKGARVMAIGVAYKAGVNDTRESPALAVIGHLSRLGALCSYHDRFVPSVEMEGLNLRSQPLDAALLATQDCVAILTDHPGVDYGLIVSSPCLVFDARGVTRHMRAANVVRL
jgi:UDP-N-acetyl-D-glucosamine dehydrogenase